jgi:hypothetical protein
MMLFIILCWCHNGGTSFHHQSCSTVRSYHPWWYVIEATVMTHTYVPFCVHPSLTGDLNSSTLSSIPESSPLLHSIVANAKPYYIFLNRLLSVSYDEHINIVLVLIPWWQFLVTCFKADQ